MNWPGLFVVAGYIGLVIVLGWWGLLAAAAHIAILLLFVKR